MTLDCKALDSSGAVIWEKSVQGSGVAEFSEFKHDLPLAAKRAVKETFILLQTEIVNSEAF